MENSVITKDQLENLLSSMRTSLDRQYVLSVVREAGQINPLEKNNLYHEIMADIKNLRDPKEISRMAVRIVENVLSDKISSIIEKIESSGENQENPSTGVSSTGKLFRRVG